MPQSFIYLVSVFHFVQSLRPRHVGLELPHLNKNDPKALCIECPFFADRLGPFL